MVLTEFFDFIATDDIRVKGHRIGIETILLDYLDGYTPEEIAQRYPTLSMQEVYTTIAFYWQNQPEVTVYLQMVEDHESRMRYGQELNPPPVVQRLRKLAQRQRNTRLPAQSNAPVA